MPLGAGERCSTDQASFTGTIIAADVAAAQSRRI
jgi:hypothetical protein